MRKIATAKCRENSLPRHTEFAEVWGDLGGQRRNAKVMIMK